MYNIIQTTLFVLFFSINAFSQNEKVQEYIEEGVKLHDNGDYQGAISQYKKALKVDKNSALANYEISSTYFAMKEYAKAVEYSDNVITLKDAFVDQAYILKGSAQDLLGKPKDAITTYKKAAKEFPNNHLIHYNLALTSYNIKNFEDAEKALQDALMVKPSHASSHLLMAYVMDEQGSRSKSLLAIYNFLLLEPQGKRAKVALELLEFQQKKGVKKEGENATTITITMPDNKKDDDGFSAADLSLSLLQASKSIEENKNKTEYELFIDNNKTFFTILGELKNEHKGFWWEYYVDFYYSLTNENHIEAFSYYIIQTKEDVKIKTWLTENEEKVQALSTWYNGFVRKK